MSKELIYLISFVLVLGLASFSNSLKNIVFVPTINLG